MTEWYSNECFDIYTDIMDLVCRGAYTALSPGSAAMSDALELMVK